MGDFMILNGEKYKPCPPLLSSSLNGRGAGGEGRGQRSWIYADKSPYFILHDFYPIVYCNQHN